MILKTEDFREDLDLLINNIGKNNFAFTRFGDGEMMIINNQFIDLLDKNTGEFKYDPSDASYQLSQSLLSKSFSFEKENYFVGLPCPCCVGWPKHLFMIKACGLPKRNITWANLFVNSNYRYFIEKLPEVFKDKKVHLISNENSTVSEMPFQIYRHYKVGRDAWKNDLQIIEYIKQEITINNYENHIFLFCAGPLSNIACCELFDFNEKNTFIDCGSIFDPYLGLGQTRDYLKGGFDARKKCLW